MSYFRPLKNPSSFRKLAAAMWKAPNDPHIFGSLDIDMSASMRLLKSYNQRYNANVTITHFIVRALAIALGRHPEVNAKVGWAQILLRPTVDIFCQVSTDGGKDLSGYKLGSVDLLSLGQIAEQLRRSAGAIRKDQDPAFRRSRNMLRALPLWGVRMVLGFLSFVSNTLGLHLPSLGMPRDPFGSAMVTSVGMMGIDTGFAPFTPIARCPIIVTVTQVRQRPWVVGDKVEPRPVLRLCGSFDHRVIDGFHAGALSGEMEQLLVNPEGLLTDSERGELGAPDAPLQAAAK